jgi:hypothetical protein
MIRTSFYDDFEKFDFGCNFSFHVIKFLVHVISSNAMLLHMSCIWWGGGVVKDIGVLLDYDSNCRVLVLV